MQKKHRVKDVQTDTDDLFKHPLHKLLGLDKHLRSIRGYLKAEVAKKVQLEECIAKEHRKLEEFRECPGVYHDAMKEDITKQIDNLNDELKVRQEPIDLLKGRLKNQIMSFKETIAKVLDKDTSLAEKSEPCLENKELRLLPYLRLSGWPSGYLSKHYYQVVGVVVPWHQVASHLLRMRPV